MQDNDKDRKQKGEFFELLDVADELEKDCSSLDTILDEATKLHRIIHKMFDFPHWFRVDLPGGMSIKSGNIRFNVNVQEELGKQVDSRLKEDNFGYCELEEMMNVLHFLDHVDELKSKFTELQKNYSESNKILHSKLSSLKDKVKVLKSTQKE